MQNTELVLIYFFISTLASNLVSRKYFGHIMAIRMLRVPSQVKQANCDFD